MRVVYYGVLFLLFYIPNWSRGKAEEREKAIWRLSNSSLLIYLPFPISRRSIVREFTARTIKYGRGED